jgi:uncharacterized protein DUF2695
LIDDLNQSPDSKADEKQDVISTLKEWDFFGQLDPRVWPTGDFNQSDCHHDYRHSEALLTEFGFDSEARKRVFEVLRSRHGYCDCEIVMNAEDYTP